jgi:glyoxylase-like metal-dependent hydrolase (beta-lactamase superfamily II)
VRQLADELYQLRGFPPNAVNVYLAGGVLIDAGGKPDARRILRQLRGRELTAHALTHSHPDHDGASKRVCDEFGLPYWVGENDVYAAENEIEGPSHPMAKLSWKVFTGPRHKVDRALHEGDEVGGFTVIETPGHTTGHLAFWRERDRALILGDVLFGMNPLTLIPGLHTPPDFFTDDPALNRDSARKLAALEPALVCFGHGPPLRDTKRFTDFVAGLPDDG